jgi:hypothetical protein
MADKPLDNPMDFWYTWYLLVIGISLIILGENEFLCIGMFS